MTKSLLYTVITLFFFSSVCRSQSVTEEVNPFIGTSNFGATNPGAVTPRGMMSVSPFNVMGSKENKYDKDSRWWSMPYAVENSRITGFSHVNLSGVGCPDLASLLVMPTTGDLVVDYNEYNSDYKNEKATPGYYSLFLNRYNILCETSATARSSILRFTFPRGKSHILMNLGEGLTNESGAMIKRISDTEIEGMKLLGTFCYESQAVFPIYFVMRVSKSPASTGYWKKQRPMTVEATWDKDAGNYKLYTKYNRPIAGDDIGAYFSFETEKDEQIEVQVGVSFVSTENARKNLEKEQPNFDFEKVLTDAKSSWEKSLNIVKVEGGTDDQRKVFYTALYHTMIHPNIINDVNMQYPAMESGETKTSESDHYTTFSLWDTYRCTHQLFTLLSPKDQLNMVCSMIDMYKASGWLPRWELFGRETHTMEGDPAIPIIVDTWMKGLRDFDVETSYKAMVKSATTPGKNNFLRPDNDEYLQKGYIALRDKYDNSVSHALEYYVADYALSKFAKALGKNDDAKRFYNQSLNYKKYFSPEFNLFRPLLPNGSFLSPFNPKQGENFEDVPGFHEGSSWNYSFMVPHDIKGLIKLHGGEKNFVERLQDVFDSGHYDPTNEPNLSYPFLFSYIKGEEWRTQLLTKQLVEKYFKNAPGGIPGNDDTGTMSAWAIFVMMGFYPDNATEPSYTFTVPIFDKITIKLDPKFYKNDKLTIEVARKSEKADRISRIEVNGKTHNGFRISHSDLVNAGKIIFYLE